MGFGHTGQGVDLSDKTKFREPKTAEEVEEKENLIYQTLSTGAYGKRPCVKDQFSRMPGSYKLGPRIYALCIVSQKEGLAEFNELLRRAEDGPEIFIPDPRAVKDYFSSEHNALSIGLYYNEILYLQFTDEAARKVEDQLQANEKNRAQP